jgi:hypothetical protein
LTSLNSQATCPEPETELSPALNLAPTSNFIAEARLEIGREMEAGKSLVKRQRSETQVRERSRCLNMLGRICGAMAMKRETHALAIHYLDQYIWQFPYQAMKIVALGALTLALKMDDAEMISKFCFQYLYNPERTVKKSASHLKLKQKRDPTREENREVKSKLSVILTAKISDDKKPVREDFNLDEVLDFETHIMVKLGFRLVAKTVNYWVELFTASWDTFVREACPQYQDALSFRTEKHPRNLSYLLQLVELQQYSMGIYTQPKVGLVLGGLYLVGRMSLQESREETPWEELCRYYRASLAKTTNLIFCDGVGMNPIFGDFLSLFGVSMAHIVESVQGLSRWLLPESVRVGEWRRVEGLNREDRLNTYLYNEELFKIAS